MKVVELVRKGFVPSNALSPQVFTVLLIWSLFANWLDSVGVEKSQIYLRLLIVLAANLAMWGFLFAASGIFRLLRSEVTGGYFFCLVIALSGFRGFLIQAVFESLNIETRTGAVVRVIFSIAYVGVGMVVIALWMHQVRVHNTLLDQMTAEQERLSILKYAAERKISEANQTLISRIKSELLTHVEKMANSKPEEALASLRGAIDQVVRPMSQQLAYGGSSWNPEPLKSMPSRVSWPRVLAESVAIKNIQPMWLTLGVGLLIAPSTIQLLTINHAWILLIVVPFVQFIFLNTWRTLAMRLFGDSSLTIQGLIVTVAYLATGGVASFIAASVLAPSQSAHVFAFPSIVFTLVIGYATSLVVQAQRAMLKVESDLEKTTSEASWEIARIRQRHRELEASLANQLHGKIQGGMAAAYLRLSRIIAQDELSPSTIEDFALSLRASIETLGQGSPRSSDLDQTIAETASTWRQVCEVSVDIDPITRQLVDQDSLLCRSLEDIVPELAFNAVKHGKAKKLTITLRLETPRTVLLEAIDDGHVESSDPKSGIGSRLLDECCVSWSRTSTSSGTSVRAILPIQSDLDSSLT